MHDGMLIIKRGPDGVEVGDVSLYRWHAMHRAAIKRRKLVGVLQPFTHCAAYQTAHAGNEDSFHSPSPSG